MSAAVFHDLFLCLCRWFRVSKTPLIAPSPHSFDWDAIPVRCQMDNALDDNVDIGNMGVGMIWFPVSFVSTLNAGEHNLLLDDNEDNSSGLQDKQASSSPPTGLIPPVHILVTIVAILVPSVPNHRAV